MKSDTQTVKPLNVSATDLIKLKRLAERAGREAADEVPKGWFTAFELAEKLGISNRKAQRMLQEFRDDFEMHIFKINRSCRTYSTPHYRLK
jgi:transcription initiation factor IIE alpha subunit